jgi:DNA-binding transcriptional MerR regulator
MNKKTRAELISAGEIVRKYNVTYQAVNHYTNLGLLHVVTKDGNMRMYAKSKVKGRLSKISMLVSEGYSLRLIRKKLIGV